MLPQGCRALAGLLQDSDDRAATARELEDCLDSVASCVQQVEAELAEMVLEATDSVMEVPRLACSLLSHLRASWGPSVLGISEDFRNFWSGSG